MHFNEKEEVCTKVAVRLLYYLELHGSMGWKEGRMSKKLIGDIELHYLHPSRARDEFITHLVTIRSLILGYLIMYEKVKLELNAKIRCKK